MLFLTRMGSAQTIQYGIVQDNADPFLLTAVAYPSFTSNNVTISTAVFTFYLPAGTVTMPNVPVLPMSGTFTNITGVWRIEKITPALYASGGGMDPALQNIDVYQCVLQNSPQPVATANQPLSLFSFRLPSDCIGGTVAVHTNNNNVKLALESTFFININNQMSVSVNDAPSTDIYSGNNPLTSTYDCPLDDTPDAVDDVTSVNEDNSVTVNVTMNDDFGTDGAATTAITITTPPASGTATVLDNGTPNNPTDDQIMYTPPANFNGVVTLSYQICDIDNDCDIAMVTITVNAVNDPPDAVNDTYTGNEDNAITGNVTSNDTDVDGPMVVVSVVTPPANGTLNLNPDGTFTYTPNANFNGTDSYVYAYCDGGTPNLCDQATVTLTVNAVNDAPDAVNDTYSGAEDNPITGNVTGNDTDPDGPMVNITVVTGPANGTLVLNLNGSFTYTPNANFTGTDSYTYSYCDGGTPNLCDQATVTLTINAVNDAPDAVNDTYTGNEDNAITGNVTTNDTDVDGPAVIITVVTGPANGTLVLNTDGTFTYTPNANFNGTDSYTYSYCDGGTPNQCDQATVSLTINAVNDAPDAVNDTYTATEDNAITGNVTTNDTDVDGPAVIISVVTPPTNGTLTLNPDGSFTYTPNLNFNGTDSYTYSYCDGGTPNQCDQATVTLTINAANDAPDAVNDTYPGTEDNPITGNVTTNDTDPDGPMTIITLVTNPTNGTIVLNADGTFTYTPNGNFNGPDGFTYQYCDGGTPNQCDQASVTFNVAPANDAPDAVNDTYSGPEDNPITGNVTANDTDADGPMVIISVVTGPANGTLVLNPNGTFTYTPNANFNGTDNYTYSYCDGGTPNQCDQATVTLTINAVNDAPDAVNDVFPGIEDNPITGNVAGNDTDPDGPMTIITVVTGPMNGTLVLNPDGTFTYTPNGNANGPDSFTYSYCDGGTPNQCDQATVTLNVAPVNDAPDAVNDTYTANEDNAITGNVTNNDTDADGPMVIISVVTGPANGTLVLNPDGTFTYTPNANFNGTDSYTYSYCDGGTPNQCDQATVTLTINAVNDAPDAVNDVFPGIEDNPITGNVAGNDTDPDGPMTNISVVTGPMNGTLVLNPDGTFTYTPNGNFNGPDGFTYQYCDGGTPNQCDQATVTLNVAPANDAPDAVNDTYTANEDNPITGNVTTNDTDPDGPNTIVTVVTPPTNGTLVLNPNGTFTYTPNGNYNGPDGFTYQYCDGGTPNQCDQATVTLTLTPVNDAPNAVDDVASTNEDVAVMINVPSNDTDVEGLNLGSVSIVTGPANGTVSVNPMTGVVTYTPNANFVGTDVFTYSICDNGIPPLCDQASVTVTVNATSVRLLAVMRLQGALFGTNGVLMRDTLRQLNYLPSVEPYSTIPGFTHVNNPGGETAAGAVFATTGANAIVDWVFVELRSSSNPATVVKTRSALLQRDGDVVDVDGVSPLVFENTAPASFYVAVRHRNHLGAMTASAIALTNAGTVIDFTNLSTPLWDDNTGLNGFEQATNTGKFALWAGNANVNNSVVYAGQDNDKNTIFNEIDQAPMNTLHSQLYVHKGYYRGDVNMDGAAIFAGQKNDVDFIFNNVDGHPKNVLRSQTYVIRQQLAE